MDATDNERNTDSQKIESITLENGGIYIWELSNGKPEGKENTFIQKVNIKAILRTGKSTVKVY